MNHARVKALKGDKTVSRKAQKSGRSSVNVTPRDSPVASLWTSPTHSASPSRVTSDVSDLEEYGDIDFDDISSAHSTGSAAEQNDAATGTFDVKAFIEGLQDRRHNNSEVRESFLEVFNTVMRTRYSPETHLWLDDVAAPLCETLIRHAGRGATAKERLLSLQAYCLTVGTSPDVDVVGTAQPNLKQILIDEDDDECQVYAIYALCMTVLYGGGLEEAALDIMNFLVEAVQTDGESIDAHDNSSVVTAALRGWAFVASHVEDYSADADAALDAFVDQLDSTDTDIQANAGHCIALVFESSRLHEIDTGEPFSLSYDPQRLAGRLNDLAKSSAKSVSRKDRRNLRENLVSVVTSLERAVGPCYSTALYMPERDSHVPSSKRTDDGGAEHGYRCKLRLGSHMTIIDTWSLLSRVTLMKIIFRGGLQNHVLVNPVVTDCLDDANWSEIHVPDEYDRTAKARKR